MSKEANDTKRLFLGFELSPPLRAELDLIRQRNNQLHDINWVSVENTHITLVFIGDFESTKIPALCTALKPVYAELQPFELLFNRFALMPDQARPSMIWARFQANQAFNVLVQGIQQVLKDQFDIEPESRKPIPHVTLARLKKFRAVHKLNLRYWVQTKELEIDHGVLWESKLHEDGPEYVALHRFEVKKLG